MERGVETSIQKLEISRWLAGDDRGYIPDHFAPIDGALARVEGWGMMGSEHWGMDRKIGRLGSGVAQNDGDGSLDGEYSRNQDGASVAGLLSLILSALSGRSRAGRIRLPRGLFDGIAAAVAVGTSYRTSRLVEQLVRYKRLNIKEFEALPDWLALGHLGPEKHQEGRQSRQSPVDASELRGQSPVQCWVA